MVSAFIPIRYSDIFFPRLNDSEKRDAIKEILKFDVDRAILNKKASEETDAPKEEEKTRRVEPAASTGGRRTAAPKYEIID